VAHSRRPIPRVAHRRGESVEEYRKRRQQVIRGDKTGSTKRLAQAKRAFTGGKLSAFAAAKKYHVSTKTLTREIAKNPRAIKRDGRWELIGQFPAYTKELGLITAYGDYQLLKILGKYMEKVGVALDENDPSYLTIYEGQTFRDSAIGLEFTFETDLATLRRLQATTPANAIKRDYRRPTRKAA
jgi:hypothetical protein